MQVSREQMIRIYQSIGYRTADGWTNKSLLERVSHIGLCDFPKIQERDVVTYHRMVNKKITDVVDFPTNIEHPKTTKVGFWNKIANLVVLPKSK
jgi:hypothetical protein